MNRVDFMDQLERLLQGIAPAERDEALQYYNGYFDDAGKENEREVIEALGNPARVAENIKRDLLNNGYGGGPVPKAQPSDRAIVEYGKDAACGEEAPGDSAGNARGDEYASPEGQFSGTGMFGGAGYGEDAQTYSYQGDAGAPAKREGMSPWVVALLATLAIFGAPLALGLLCVLFGIIVCWYALLLCVGVTAVCLLIAMIVLVVTGILCFAADPWAGMALLGGGLVCGGIGMLFLMLTVALGGIVTPSFWRGVGRLFGGRRRKNAMA